MGQELTGQERDARNAKIRKRYVAGVPVAEIANDFGISSVHVYSICYGHKRPSRKNATQLRNVEIARRRMSGESLSDIGEDFGITRERVRQICQSQGVVGWHGDAPEDYAPVGEIYDDHGADFGIMRNSFTSLLSTHRDDWQVPYIQRPKGILYHVPSVLEAMRQRLVERQPQEVPDGWASLMMLAEDTGRNRKGVLLHMMRRSGLECREIISMSGQEMFIYPRAEAVAYINSRNRWVLRQGSDALAEVIAEVERGDTVDEIAERHGYHAPSLYTRLRDLRVQNLRRHDQQWRVFTDEERATMERMYNAGHKPAAIAKELGLTPGQVSRFIHNTRPGMRERLESIPAGYATHQSLFRLCGSGHYQSDKTMYASLMHHGIEWVYVEGVGRVWNIHDTERMVRRMVRRKRQREMGASA